MVVSYRGRIQEDQHTCGWACNRAIYVRLINDHAMIATAYSSRLRAFIRTANGKRFGLTDTTDHTHNRHILIHTKVPNVITHHFIVLGGLIDVRRFDSTTMFVGLVHVRVVVVVVVVVGQCWGLQWIDFII